MFDRGDLACDQSGCDLRIAIGTPLVVEERVVGTLQVFAAYPTAGLARAADEVARWVSGQLELAQLDASRTRLMEAEVRALRAQISPHFIYNSLGAIASFVRTDPDRARTCCSSSRTSPAIFRRHGDYTTLAEELRYVERYLLLEQARFGDRLQVTLSIAPRCCRWPSCSCASSRSSRTPSGTGSRRQAGSSTSGSWRATACWSARSRWRTTAPARTPEKVRRALAGDTALDSVGLGNVDGRLRNAFGDDYGLVVETAPGAGTKVLVRVPKFAPGFHEDHPATRPGRGRRAPRPRRARVPPRPRPGRRGGHQRLRHRGPA